MGKKYCTCEICGKVVPQRGAWQKYCPDCAVIMNNLRNSPQEKKKKLRAEAVKAQHQKISNIAVEAAKAKMTYGQYVAAYCAKK